MKQLLLFGKIIKPFGLKGEVKVDFFSDDPHDYKNYEKFFIQDKLSPSGYREIRFEEIRRATGRSIIKIEGFDDVDAAELLRDFEIFVYEDELPKPDEDEFYIKDLMLCKVFWNGEVFGDIDDILEISDGFVVLIKQVNKKVLAVPFRDRYLDKVDIEGKELHLKNIEGLL